MFTFPSPLPRLDLAALVLFFMFWLAYSPLLQRLARPGALINSDMTVLRRRWMANMAARDNRFIDSQLLGHAINSASFFASSNLIVIAATSGALFGDSAQRSVEKLVLVSHTNHGLFQIKLALVIVVLARGFLDFIWAIRQLNYTLAAIGAAPTGATPEIQATYGAATAKVLNPALHSFNTGVRGYYFALAAASWLLNPVALIIVTLGAVAMLAWRQAGSGTATGVRELRSLIDSLPPPHNAAAPRDDPLR